MDSFEERLKRLSELLEKGNAVFFGGAGVSTESGVPDFRSSGGIFAQKYDYPPEEILSHGFFYSKTAVFYDFYKKYMMPLDAKPNAAHYALAKLEEKGLLKAVITQNIDGLHQAAGSGKVLELHGSIHRNTCTVCGRKYDARYVKNSAGVPVCECGGLIKPDVVLYGEPLPEKTFEEAEKYVNCADTLIVGGTSLNVYPAAGLVRCFRGENLVLINKTRLFTGTQALVFDEPVGEVFAKAVLQRF